VCEILTCHAANTVRLSRTGGVLGAVPSAAAAVMGARRIISKGDSGMTMMIFSDYMSSAVCLSLCNVRAPYSSD